MSKQGKICVVCGGDCANLPRIKDPRGRYYHKECHEHASERRAGGVKMAAAGAADEGPGADVLLEPDGGFDLEALIGDLDRSRACPQCSSPLEASAVICVKCGYNMREGAPLAPPVVQRAPRVRDSAARGNIWPIVIGVISLLYAGFLLLEAFVEFDDVPELEGGALSKIIAIAFAAWLGLAAVGVLFRSQSGAVWMLRWGIVQIVLLLVCGGFAVAMLAAVGDRVTQRVGIEAGLFIGAFVIAIIIKLIWPVFLVIWLRRSSIQKQIGAWR